MVDNPIIASMPRYRSHKVVRAMKITGVDTVQRREHEPMAPGATAHGENAVVEHAIWLSFGEQRMAVPLEWSRRHAPESGGYYVVYDDGYASFSPAKAFEEGYTLIDETPGWGTPTGRVHVEGGMILRAKEGAWCLDPGTEVRVEHDEDGFFVQCRSGRHNLSGDEDLKFFEPANQSIRQEQKAEFEAHLGPGSMFHGGGRDVTNPTWHPGEGELKPGENLDKDSPLNATSGELVDPTGPGADLVDILDDKPKRDDRMERGVPVAEPANPEDPLPPTDPPKKGRWGGKR